jgi:hypothetical protein
LLNISLIDSKGEITVNRYLFDQQGIFLEIENLPNILPLSLAGDNMRVLDLPDFLALANRVPMLMSCLAQDLFMKTH